MTPDVNADMAAQALSLAAKPRRYGVAVLVASRDPEMIADAGPRVARALYPGRRFGAVIHHEPYQDPANLPDGHIARSLAGQWSEVIIEEL